MDVIRDRAIVELNQNNVKVLQTNLEATRDRFQIGDLTRTDVAQSEARLQLGYSQLATAQGNATASEATYRQQIGHPPGDLAPPPPLPPLPTAADEAVQIALASNPDLVAISRQQEIASGYDVNVARASRLPTLSAQASGDYVNDASPAIRGQGLPSSGSQHDDRPRREHPDLPGRPSGRPHSPGAGAAGTASRAGGRHRARSSPADSRGLRQLSGRAGGDPGRDRRRAGQPARARGQPGRTERRHPNDHRSAERRAGPFELAGRARDREARLPMSRASSC